MKNTSKMTFCAITAALAATFMLTSYFPYLTYAIPAISGLMFMMPVIEIGVKWAFGAYLTSVLPVFLFAEVEAKLLYIAVFGYYPILKAIIDSNTKKPLGWVLKLIAFNLAAATVYAVLAPIMGIPTDEFGELGKWGLAVFCVAANVVFVMYDVSISQVAAFYMIRLHPKIKKFIR